MIGIEVAMLLAELEARYGREIAEEAARRARIAVLRVSIDAQQQLRKPGPPATIIPFPLARRLAGNGDPSSLDDL